MNLEIIILKYKLYEKKILCKTVNNVIYWEYLLPSLNDLTQIDALLRTIKPSVACKCMQVLMGLCCWWECRTHLAVGQTMIMKNWCSCDQASPWPPPVPLTDRTVSWGENPAFIYLGNGYTLLDVGEWSIEHIFRDAHLWVYHRISLLKPNFNVIVWFRYRDSCIWQKCERQLHLTSVTCLSNCDSCLNILLESLRQILYRTLICGLISWYGLIYGPACRTLWALSEDLFYRLTFYWWIYWPEL